MDRSYVLTVVGIIALLGALACLFDAYRWNRTPQSLFRFFLLEKKLELPGFVSAIVAANFSIGNFIVFIAVWGASYGLAGLVAFVANLALNAIGFLLIFPKIKGYISSSQNNGTIHDYLATAFSGNLTDPSARLVRLSASIATVSCLLLAIVFEISLAAQLLSPSNALVQAQLFCAMTVVIALLTAYGGLRTLIASDVVNSLVMIVALAALIALIARLRPEGTTLLNTDLSLDAFKRLGWPALISITVIGSGWMLVAMDQWQRACAARNANVTKSGLAFYFVILSFCAVCYATWGGFAVHALPSMMQPGQAAELAGATNPLLDIARLPATGSFTPTLIALAISGLIFAAISTANTFLTVCSHSLTTDVLVGSALNVPMNNLTAEQSQTLTKVARMVIVGFAALVMVFYGIAIWLDLMSDPLSFFYITYSVQFALLAPMVVSVMAWRPSASWAVVSVWIGVITSLGLGFYSWHAMQSGVPILIGRPPVDWLTLTPVVTAVVGAIPLLFGALVRGK